MSSHRSVDIKSARLFFGILWACFALGTKIYSFSHTQVMLITSSLKHFIKTFFFAQIFVTQDGAILTDTATSRVRNVPTGLQHCTNVVTKIPCLSMLKTTKKMYLSNIETMVRRPGLGSTTNPQRETSFGKIVVLEISPPGLQNNLTTLEKKIVYTHSV